MWTLIPVAGALCGIYVLIAGVATSNFWQAAFGAAVILLNLRNLISEA